MPFCPNCGTQYEAQPIRCQCGFLFGSPSVGAAAVPRIEASIPSANVAGMFRYTGNGGELLMLYVKLVIFSLFTLGIYSFWGRTEIRKYHFSRTLFANQPFSFHGTGKELFFGWLKLIGMYVGFYLAVMLVVLVLGKDGAIVGGVLVVGGLLALLPFAIWGAIRYRASRTEWQGRRFEFRAEFLDTAKTVWVGLVLTAVTLGLYTPFFLMSVRKHVFNNLWYGGQRFEFYGEGKDIAWPFIKFVLLFLPTLTLYRFWFQAEVNNYAWGRTKFAGAAFRSTMQGMDLLLLTVTNWLLTVFTLGIGYPWAEARQMEYVLSNLKMETLPNVQLLNPGVRQPDGLGESLGHVLGTDADMGAGFGL
jgi:uncharacterized membrane protein YjgN (DUF898 family)